jgi:hypothetical protein
MSYQIKLQILRLNGWTDERVSTTLGDLLGSSGPTSMTVYRWRTGRTNPEKVYQGALDRLFDNQNTEGENSEQDNQSNQ